MKMGDISLVLQMLMGGGGSFSAGGPGKGMHSRLCKLCPDLNFVEFSVSVQGIKYSGFH